MKKVTALGILCVFMVFLGSCKKSAPTVPEVPDPPTIRSFTATPSDIFSGTNSTLIWSALNATTVSIDQGIGNVSSSGTQEVGPTETTSYTLTATNSDGTVTKSCTVTVKAIISGVSVTSSNSTIYVGQTEQMTATITMPNGTTQAAIGRWGSDNWNVATVNQSGIVKGIGSGTATIYIDTTEGGNRGTKLLTVRKIWSKSGVGDALFDMPTYVSRVTVTAEYTGNLSDFRVNINGSSWIWIVIGTYWGIGEYYEETFLTNGGVVQIIDSGGVSWSFTEVLTTAVITNTSRIIPDITNRSDPRYREYEIYKHEAAKKNNSRK